MSGFQGRTGAVLEEDLFWMEGISVLGESVLWGGGAGVGRDVVNFAEGQICTAGI